MNARLCFLWILTCSLILGCRQEPARSEYVARVGSQYLTQGKLAEMLTSLHVGGDTADARQQIIEQWVTNALLYHEALRRDLPTEPEVQALLREQERAVLVNELTTRLYTEAGAASISDVDVQTYYEQHRDELRLREPFVHVLYLSARSLADAEVVREAVDSRPSAPPAADRWDSLIAEHAANPDEAHALASRYYAEGQLFGAQPPLRAQLQRLAPGETAPIFEIDSLFHVLHLVDRAEEGAIPKRAWVEPEIRRRLLLRARKQMYAREVERLRSEALARDELDIR